MVTPLIKSNVCGNDFVLAMVSSTHPVWSSAADQARLVCCRQRGIGADQLVLIGIDCEGAALLKVLNPDGSEAPFCANATIAAAAAVSARTSAQKVCFQTLRGIRTVDVEGDGWCRLTVQQPIFLGESQPILVRLGGQVVQLSLYLVDSGTQHAVCFVPSVEQCPVRVWGPQLESEPSLNPPTNVMFVEDIGPGNLAMRSWERGMTGETRACGSGAVASVFVRNQAYSHTSMFSVHCPGGTLRVQIEAGLYCLHAKPEVEFVIDYGLDTWIEGRNHDSTF
jgi:diaminopimelate epimerase